MALYLLNRSSSKSIVGSTSYELWTGSTPNVQNLRTFGCVTPVKVIVPHQNKLGYRSQHMIFVGYEPGSMCTASTTQQHSACTSAGMSSSTRGHSGHGPLGMKKLRTSPSRNKLAVSPWW
jgi:predicted esterase